MTKQEMLEKVTGIVNQLWDAYTDGRTPPEIVAEITENASDEERLFSAIVAASMIATITRMMAEAKQWEAEGQPKSKLSTWLKFKS